MTELADAQTEGRRVQRRGEERRQAILDAAEQLLTEEGYDAATLKAIGERAGIPTASLYHYFPDRHQVEVELLARHLETLSTEMDAIRLPARLTIEKLVDAVVAPLTAYFRAHRSMVELWFRHRQPDLEEMVRAFDQAQAEEFWAVARRERLVRRTTPLLVVELAFEAGNRLFDLAFRTSATGDDEILDQARRMVSAYLATYAPQAR